MKTPEELAEEYLRKMWGHDGDATEEMHCVSDFLAGYQASAPQWISVNDRLPELEEQVLVYGRPSLQFARFVEPAKLRKRCTYGAIPIADEFWWEGYDIIGYDGEVDEIVEVTHWMPLPESPKEEG